MIRFQTEFELPTCSVDPVTAVALALGGIAGGAASSMAGGGSAPPTPQAPPAAAAPQQQPVGSRDAARSSAPSFVGASAVPSGQSGQKTLLGQ